MKKFPKIVYVCWHTPVNGEPYLELSETTESLAEIDSMRVVAVYELMMTKKLVNKSTLE